MYPITRTSQTRVVTECDYEVLVYICGPLACNWGKHSGYTFGLIPQISLLGNNADIITFG